MRALLLLLIIALPPSAAAVAPSCEPGTFDPTGGSALLCDDPAPVQLEAEAVGLVVTLAPEQCIAACGPAFASAGATVTVDDERGNAIPEGHATLGAARSASPGTFGEETTCAGIEGAIAWGPFAQGFGDDACVPA